jgi:hypothetical protein
VLKKFQNRRLNLNCDKCKTDYDHQVEEGMTIVFLPEAGAYPTFNVICPNCGTFEFINMNIPVDEMAEHEFEEDMPYEEINQRYYVRQLIRTVREDFSK